MFRVILRLKRKQAHLFSVLKFSEILLQQFPTLRFDTCLLPDRVLGEELIGSFKGRVVEDAGVALQ